MTSERLEQQIRFLEVTDGLKNILRKTSPIGALRRENSAEHSWQVMLAAVVLQEHADDEVDLLKVLRMLALHDCIELLLGDTLHYDKQHSRGVSPEEREAAATVFGCLPPDQRESFEALWLEFEERESAEARFAAALDRLMAFILNRRNGGGTWTEFAIPKALILEKNAHIAEGSSELWRFAKAVLDEFLPEK